MSKKKEEEIDFSKIAAHIIKTTVEDFAEDSYLPYAHYVIMNRALISDDGLKPVQRRILYAMEQLGLTDVKDFMKAAQIVGEVMGKYHPHGDASIGDALSRLGQLFSMRVPLVDVQGSVGFTTGDDPAAPRYWEGRPTKAAMELTADLKRGAVEMGENYDGKFPEPTMLPVKWPNGIINGSQGIAVGYASTIVPHNPGEVMDAVIAMVKNPDLTTEELMKIMPGPDMPTGGILTGYEGVKEYYETGKGTFAIRGKCTIVPKARGTHHIIFNEAPYQVSAEQIIASVSKNKKDRDRFKEISFVKDLSDIKNGFRLSVGVKAGANPSVVLKELFKWTPLEESFSVNMNVLKYGVPKVSSVREVLEGFIEFRSECIVNKTKYRLNELEKNIERLDGIIKVLVDIDEAIRIIRSADDMEIANSQLMSTFEINEEQSSYILSMPLRRLTKSDSLSIRNEIVSLRSEKDELELLLQDEKAFDKFMIKELIDTKKIIDDPRRTVINNKTEEELKAEEIAIKNAAAQDLENTDCYVTLFADKTLVRTENPYVQESPNKGIREVVRMKTQENLIFIAKNGHAIKIPLAYIPEDTVTDVSVPTGMPAKDVVGIGRETLEDDSHGILLITSEGGVNVVNGRIPTSSDFQIVKLNDNEEVISVIWLEKKDLEDNNLTMVSSDGYATTFPLEQVRTSNSGAGTVRGMNLNEGAVVVGASVANYETSEIISCTHKTLKNTKLTEVPIRNRGAKGVILQSLGKDDEVISAFTGANIVASKSGKVVKLPKLSERTGVGSKRIGTGIVLGHLKV